MTKMDGRNGGNENGMAEWNGMEWRRHMAFYGMAGGVTLLSVPRPFLVCQAFYFKF